MNFNRRSFHTCPERQFGGSFLNVLTFGLGSALFPSAKSVTSSNINPNPTPTTAQTVDPSTTSSVNNLGRAALIMTSPQGVIGTDPTNRYALLGNQTGLGNQ